jgi:hypothetical protein
MKIRKLLILTKPTDELEKKLQKMYIKRVQEMLKKAISLESIFSIFDEIFHGIAKTEVESQDLYSFYEAFLTVTSYYQHSQAGGGSLIAKLFQELLNIDSNEKVLFEGRVSNFSKILNKSCILDISKEEDQKFDIVLKLDNTMVICELKKRIDSGCTAGRIEIIEKFIKFVELLDKDEKLYNCFNLNEIKEIKLIGGVLYDIEGNPATLEKDMEWQICYSGLKNRINRLISFLKNKNLNFQYENNYKNCALQISFILKNIKFVIYFLYGNQLIEAITGGESINYLENLKEKLETKLYDDIWLAQLISINERSILNQMFRKNNKLKNTFIYILDHYISDVEFKNYFGNFLKKKTKSKEDLKKLIMKVKNIIKKDKELLKAVSNSKAIQIMKTETTYTIDDYLADLIQILLCPRVFNYLLKQYKSLHNNKEI